MCLFLRELVQVVVPGAKKPWEVPLLRLESRELGGKLEAKKKVYGAAYTKLIKKVKKLEKTVKSNQAKRRAKIVVSDDEEDLEDSSKQERMIEEIDQDAGVTLITHTHSQEDQLEDQLGVFNGDKVLADAAKANVYTYTRRRRAVSTSSGRISTASRLFSTAEESVSTAGASMPVSNVGMVQDVKISIPSPVVGKDKGKAAVRLQEELDEEERQRMVGVHEAAQSFTKKEWETLEPELKLMKRYLGDYKQRKGTSTNVNTFVTMETEDRGRALDLAAGSSQATIIDSTKVGSSKRDAEAELDHEGSKRQKTNEASGLVQEQPKEEEKELSNIQSLTRRFTLKNLENIRRSSGLVELKRLFEPNTDDTLWKLQRYMHDPLKWRLYDTCGVHHVSTKRGIDIFMLVEKEYPLSKGVLTLMLVNRLLVEQHLEMANELLRKIFIQANRPRQ
ncbi:hypothetical protein Tco_1407101 [Tanacetum coccineum]